MKFECHIHHLFDTIRKRKLAAGLTEAANDFWHDELLKALPEMERAPVFVLREDPNEMLADSMLDIVEGQNKLGRLRMPFPMMFLEMRVPPDPAEVAGSSGVWIVQAQWQDETPSEPAYIAIRLFAASSDDLRGWTLPPCGAWLAAGADNVMTGPIIKEPEYFDETNHPRQGLIKEAEHDLAGIAMTFGAVLVMLDSPAIEVTAVKVPRDINRGRRLMKRSPVPDHTILRLPRVAYVESDGTGTHRHPRMHWRRPHRREYKPGQFTDIPLTLVAKREDQPLPPAPTVEVVIRK